MRELKVLLVVVSVLLFFSGSVIGSQFPDGYNIPSIPYLGVGGCYPTPFPFPKYDSFIYGSYGYGDSPFPSDSYSPVVTDWVKSHYLAYGYKIPEAVKAVTPNLFGYVGGGYSPILSQIGNLGQTLFGASGLPNVSLSNPYPYPFLGVIGRDIPFLSYSKSGLGLDGLGGFDPSTNYYLSLRGPLGLGGLPMPWPGPEFP